MSDKDNKNNKIRIRSKRDGFRRCGVAHSSEWVEHSGGRFTPEELEALQEEPMLQVEVVEPPPPPPTKMDLAPVDATPVKGIMDAISYLDPKNPSLWSKDGKPTTDALSKVLDRKVTAKERDAAWGGE